jgi:hypothetical protein
MTYPASPYNTNTNEPRHVRPDAVQVWAGGVATAVVAALIALAATGIMYLLMLGTPSPGLFFGWIIALATVVAIVYPFSTSAPLDQKAATAVVDLVIGIAIGSLLSAVAVRSIRHDVPPYDPDATNPVYPPSHTPGERGE